MNLLCGGLQIRHAEGADAEQLCRWWNDGTVMAHAGFPDGLGTTPEHIRGDLSRDSGEAGRRLMIMLDGCTIGEMNYARVDGRCAKIGINICDTAAQEKGYGTRLIAMLLETLFMHYGYDTVVLDTNLKNERAQHVYEKKLGFRRVGVRVNAWRDQRGEWQSAVDFALCKANWLTDGKRPYSL